jgi:hypothetical protein
MDSCDSAGFDAHAPQLINHLDMSQTFLIHSKKKKNPSRSGQQDFRVQTADKISARNDEKSRAAAHAP